MKSKIALVLGATGLVGEKLINLLTKDDYYESIILLNRRQVGYQNPKIKEKVVDFEDIESLIKQVNVNDIFCCIGTTIKKAGSKEAFEKVDFDIPVAMGKIAERSGVKNFIVISSLGADEKSNNFYSSVKGRMENKMMQYKLQHLTILRPSLLLGKRDEKRTGEGIAQIIFSLFGILMIGPLKKYKAISAQKVAAAMIYYAKNPAETIIENDYLHKI